MKSETAEFKPIEYIQWGVLSGAEWRAYSVADITKPCPKDMSGAIDNRYNTPYDPRMGEQRDLTPCMTCDKNNMHCPGHFGHISLPFPIYNKVFTTQTIRLLQCVCSRCARPRIVPFHIEMLGFMRHNGFARTKAIADKCNKSFKVCPWENCGEPLIYYSLPVKSKGEGGVIYYTVETSNKVVKREEFSATDAYDVLSRITHEYLTILGFNSDLLSNDLYKNPEFLIDENSVHTHQFRPESMLYTVFPVLPPGARPYVQTDDGIKNDDLTDKYNDLIKAVNLYHTFEDVEGEAKKSTVSTRRGRVKTKFDVGRDIMENVWTLCNNKDEKNKVGNNNTKAHRSIICRLIGKDGRIQQNIGGKRSDFTARTVIIGGGIRLRNDQIGVPEDIAATETKPVFIGPWNIVHWQAQLKKGKVNYVTRHMAGGRIDKTILRTLPDGGKDFIIRNGDTIGRQLQDGDIVLVNRQPSLRIESMVAFRVKIVTGMAFMLGLYATRGFNADFDGDEMNLHVPQSLEAEVEIMTLSRFSGHIVTAQRNSPINCTVQDGLVSSYMLTMSWENGKRTMVQKKTAMTIYKESEILESRVKDLLFRAKQFYPDYIIKTSSGYEFTDSIPGSLFFSVLFPHNFCYTKTTDTHPEKHEILIEDGVMLPDSAPLCVKAVGAKTGSVVHEIWKNSQEMALCFISDLQQITDRWLPTHGFSIGIQDCFASSEADVAKILIETRMKVGDIIQKQDGTEEKIEADINTELNNAMIIGPKLAKSSMAKGDRNALNIMRNSGAKGSPINLAQIVAFVGPQNIKGQRMPMQLTHGSRCLPSFLPGDNSPEARGFVEHNYVRGLNPQEAFFHAAAGRDGVISTAIKTADTGYLQKKITRKIEDTKVWVDGTSRDANGRIISFMYGDDGMDAKKLVSVKGLDVPFFVNPLFLARQLNSDARRSKEVTSSDKPRKLLKTEVELMKSFISYSSISSPVIDMVTNNARDTLEKIIYQAEIYECKISDFIVKICDAYNTSKAPYGLPVGLIAGAGVGEPATQMVLNTFHFAGCKGKDVSSGVPRYKEIINTTKTKCQKNTSCQIYFNYPIIQNNAKTILELECKNKTLLSTDPKLEINQQEIINVRAKSLSAIEEMRNTFEETFVGDFIKTHELKYLPNEVSKEYGSTPVGLLTYEEYSEEWWVTFSKELDRIPNGAEPESWVIILQFDVEKLYRRRIDLDDLCVALEHNNDKFVCVPSPNIIGKMEVYCLLSEIKEHIEQKLELPDNSSKKGLITSENINYYVCRDVMIDLIEKTQLSGIRGISKIYPREIIESREYMLDTDGSNFIDVLTTRHVDAMRTLCDDMHSIFSVLGIEATRMFLFNEVTRIISFDGTYVNPRHISTLVDSMTINGILEAASRDGIKRDDVGPNAKIMFEKNIDNASTACAYTEKDNMVSMASSVMYGKLAKIGPGAVTIATKKNT